MVKRAKEGNYSIRYSRIPSRKWWLSMFVDASLRGLPEKIESAYGWIVFLGEGYRIGKHNVAMPLD